MRLVSSLEGDISRRVTLLHGDTLQVWKPPGPIAVSVRPTPLQPRLMLRL